MADIKEYAYGKLNISLDVLDRRSDGYHNLCMVMQSVSLRDDLLISLRRDGRINIYSNLSYIPCDQRNLAAKAARAFFSAMGDKTSGADIRIKKRIPVCAGMGGGSADGAAVLRALNRFYKNPFTRRDLCRIAEGLGSDVAFCVSGGTCLATGRGEILEPLSPIPDCHIVICKPRFSISTPTLFSRLDQTSIKYRPDTRGLLEAFSSSDLRGICQRMYNVFEDVLPQGTDEIKSMKRVLLEEGALGSVMTGTGSAVFGVFQSLQQAENAARVLSSHYQDVFVCRPQLAV